MKRLLRSLERGFSAAKTDRIEEWGVMRGAGFLRPFLRRNLPLVSGIVVVQSLFRWDSSKSSAGNLTLAFGTAAAVGLVIGLVDYVVWRQREAEWEKSKEAEKARPGWVEVRGAGDEV